MKLLPLPDTPAGGHNPRAQAALDLTLIRALYARKKSEWWKLVQWGGMGGGGRLCFWERMDQKCRRQSVLEFFWRMLSLAWRQT
jgi:hypothetical protein